MIGGSSQSPLAKAQVLAAAGKFPDALKAADLAVRAAPRSAAALALQAALLNETGDPAKAVTVFQRALAIDPSNAAAHSNHGGALARLRRPADAVAAYSRALAINPGYALAWCNRAGQQLELENPQAALEDADRAVALNPGLAPAHRNRGLALIALGRLEEALACAGHALTLAEHPEPHAQRGAILGALGHYEESLPAYDRAVALAAGDPEQRHRRALARLRLGQFEGGWDDYEHRWRADLFRRHSTGYAEILPRISTQASLKDIDGRSVLLIDEQGIGDQIMFASMLPDLAAVASSVTCLCDPRMLALLRHSFPGVEFIPVGVTLDLSRFGHVLAIGSLGRLFRNRTEDFPGVPYLSPAPAPVEAWRRRLGPKTARLRVGLSWRGGTRITGTAQRSLPLAGLAPLLNRSDCEFVSLQYGGAQAEIEAVNATLARPVLSLPAAGIDDFEQLAAVVLNLDAVVSVQTALVHLCGAVGAPCLAMLPSVPEWRYGAGGERMVWYGSVTLLRQAAAGGWGPVIGAVGERLDAMRGR